jgi:transposase-like protein
MVEEAFEPGMTVSLVARRHGVAPNLLFTWRRLAAQGSLTAAGSGEEVVPASDYRALQNQVRELQANACPVASRTMKHLPSYSSTDQGGGKRCAEAWERRAHDGKLTQPVCGVVNGTNWFLIVTSDPATSMCGIFIIH